MTITRTPVPALADLQAYARDHYGIPARPAVVRHYAVPAPDGDLRAEWDLAQAALKWREERFGISMFAPLDRQLMNELVNAYLAMG